MKIKKDHFFKLTRTKKTDVDPVPKWARAAIGLLILFMLANTITIIVLALIYGQ